MTSNSLVLARLSGVNAALAIKAPVRAATTAAITLAGFQTIDGVTFASTDAANLLNTRCLVKNQVDQTTNGVYDVKVGTWTRSADFDGNDDVVNGTRVYVAQGTTQSTTTWVLSTSDPVYIVNSGSGRSNIAFTLAPEGQASISAAAAAASAASASTSASSASASAAQLPVSATAFGATGDGVTDDTAALQAAIDYAFNNNLTRIFLPPGSYKITSPIYLDPPGNLRSNPTNPTEFGWTVELIGSGTNLGGVGGGSTLKPNYDTAPALWVGPGSNVKVSRVNCTGQVSVAHPKLHNAANAGIAISGGNAGAQKTRIEDCWIQNFYVGISVGQNNGSFGESNIFSNCFGQTLYYGIKFYDSNTVVNLVENCALCASINIASQQAQVNVIGGEYFGQAAGGPEACQYAGISSVSTLTRVGSPPYNFSFTATIGGPSSAWANGVFNAVVLLLPHFGAVPFTITNFNSGTSVATFQTTNEWIGMFYYLTGGTFLDTDTDFNTELQAATHIYACEMITTFQGPIIAEGWRTELTTSSTLLDTTGQPAASWGVLRDGFANYDITLGTYYTAGTDNYAHFLAQQSFGFIRQAGSILMESNEFILQSGHAPGELDTVVFDLTGLARFVYRQNNIVNPNIRSQNSNGGRAIPPTQTIQTSGYFGGDVGEFDRPVMRSRASGASSDNWRLRSTGSKATPYFGTVPAGLPRLSPADVAALTGVTSLASPQTITQLNGNLTIQQLQDHHLCSVSAAGYQNYALAKRNGQYWSYGADLAINANYKGQTPFLNLTGGANQWWVFPGLEVVIAGNTYVVTGVYYSLGYITVQPTYGSPPATSALAGTKTTVFTLTSIGQNPIIMQKFGRQCEFVTSALSELAGNTYAQGDIVWITNASASASPGWVCVVAGVVGSGAQFAPFAALGGAVTP